MSPRDHFRISLAVLLVCWARDVTGQNISQAVKDNKYILVTNGTVDTCKPPELYGQEMTPMLTRSKLTCAASCSKNASCSSMAYNEEEHLCLLYSTSWHHSQCRFQEGWRTYNKHPEPLCLNGGEEKLEGGCQCYNSYIGDRCERLMEDCMEGLESGHYPNMKDLITREEVHWILPRASPYSMRAKCRGNGMTTFQNQNSGPLSKIVDFNRTWADYVEGFGHPDGAHWLGLEKIYYLTNSKNYDLNLYIRLWNSTNYRVVYRNFRLTDMTTFTVSVGSYKEPAKKPFDLMGGINSMPFSTFDSDNDNNTGRNCAMDFGGGWWFSDCQEDYLINGRVWRENAEGNDFIHYGDIKREEIKYMNTNVE